MPGYLPGLDRQTEMGRTSNYVPDLSRLQGQLRASDTKDEVSILWENSFRPYDSHGQMYRPGSPD